MRFVDVRVSIAEVRVKSVKGRYYSSIALSGVKRVRAQHEGGVRERKREERRVA